MSGDRQTAPIEQPVDGAAKTPSLTPPRTASEGSHAMSAHDDRAEAASAARAPVTTSHPQPSPVPSPLREARDGTRRRHALRIPDDEVSRPQLPGAGRPNASPSSEPLIHPEPSVAVVKPTPIITISEPPPPIDQSSHAPDIRRLSTPPEFVPPSTAISRPPVPDLSIGPEDDEVEVRFDDDLPATALPRVQAVSIEPAVPALVAQPPRPSVDARAAAEARAAEVAQPPRPSVDARAAAEARAAEEARAEAEAIRAEAEARAAEAARAEPRERSRASAERGARGDPDFEAERAAAGIRSAAREAGGAQVEIADDLEPRAHAADVPEIAAEDVVTLEPPPARPMSALPPVRPGAASQAAAPSSTAPAAKPPRIPTPRSSLVIVPPHVGSVPSQPSDGVVVKRKARLWWEELFNDDYLRATEKIAEEQMKREVTFIEESLGVERGGALLDLACGTGRHAIELARRGYEVVGFDLSLAMLARAGEEAQDLGAKLNFVQGDMREMTFDEQFDGVYCWCTSFGYFEEEKNAQVVARIGRALKAGGTFLLDVANRDFLVRQAPSLAWFEGDGCVCMDEMSIDFITSRLKVKRTIMFDDGRTREIEYSMRVYSLHELGKILHEQGFKVREVSGRLATPGVFFGNESPRAIILAEKK